MKEIESTSYARLQPHIKDLSWEGHSYPIEQANVHEFTTEDLAEYALFQDEKCREFREIATNIYLLTKYYVNVEFFSGVVSHYVLFLLPDNQASIIEIGFTCNDSEERIKQMLNVEIGLGEKY